MRQQALQRRARESAGGAIQHQHGIDARHTAMAMARQPQQQRTADTAQGPAGGQHFLAGQPVDQLACRQKQQQHRNELRQPDKGQSHGVAREVIDLPGHHHRLDLGGTHGKDPRDQENKKAAVLVAQQRRRG